jgi:flavin-dependent dehydrogenase
MYTNVLIIGGGPGGTACGIELKNLGIDAVIVEKAEMPRFHIGESMTGECGGSVRKLGLDDIENRMADDGHPIKWGTIVYGKGGKNSFYIPVMRRDEDNQLREQSTWQVKRSTFDKMLLDAAIDIGVETIKGTATEVLKEGDTVTGAIVGTEDGVIEIKADIVVDATGQSTFFSRQGIASKRELGNYSTQIAVFGHFKNALRDEGDQHKIDDTLIMYRERYQWAWFIPIDEEIVSIGVVVPTDFFKSKNMSREEFLLSEMPLINPELEWRVRDAELEGEVRAVYNYSYQIKEFTGKGFICVGDAHRFIDPIFSLGLHFALHEGRHAAKAIAEFLENPDYSSDNPFLAFQEYSEAGMENIQTMLDAFWDYPLAFSLYLKDKKYRDGFIDLFAGRVYDVQENEGVKKLRQLREQSMALNQESQLQSNSG